MLATEKVVDIDRRFLLDGAYRPRASLSIAERMEYGLRSPQRHFQHFIQRALAPLTRPQEAAVAVFRPREAGTTSARSRLSALAGVQRSSSRLRPMVEFTSTHAALTRPGRLNNAAWGDSAGVRESAEPKGRDAGVRFRVRADGCILLGMVHGRTLVTRLLTGRCHGALKPD